jgi:adenylate cyclase
MGGGVGASIDLRSRLRIATAQMTGQGPWPQDRGMELPATLAWLVDEAAASCGPDRFLAELGGRLLADGLPLAGGALTLAVPHPIIARHAWLWRASTGAVIEALGFAGGPFSQTGRAWLAELGPVQEDMVGPAPDSPVLGWAGTRPFGPTEAGRLRQATRFAAAPLRPGRAGGAGSTSRGLSRPAQCRPGAGRHAAPRGRRDHPRRAALR